MSHDQIPFQKLQSDLLEFQRILQEFNFEIPPGSWLESSILDSIQLLDQYHGKETPDLHLDIRPVYRNLFGAHDMVDKLLKVRKHPAFKQLEGHIALLTRSVVGQNVRSPVTDAGANKLFELYLMLAAMRLSDTVEVDDPNRSAGDNPDILFETDAEWIGIACKALHSANPENLVDHLVKAIDQVEKSKATLGMVAFNIKNVIDHDRYWPILNQDDYDNGEEPEFGAYVSSSVAQKLLAGYGFTYYEYLDSQNLPSLLNLFENKKTPPEIYLFLNSTCGIIRGREIPATNFKHLMRIKFTDADTRMARIGFIAERLNHYIQYTA